MAPPSEVFGDPVMGLGGLMWKRSGQVLASCSHSDDTFRADTRTSARCKVDFCQSLSSWICAALA